MLNEADTAWEEADIALRAVKVLPDINGFNFDKELVDKMIEEHRESLEKLASR